MRPLGAHARSAFITAGAGALIAFAVTAEALLRAADPARGDRHRGALRLTLLAVGVVVLALALASL